MADHEIGLRLFNRERAFIGYTLFCETFALEGNLKQGKTAYIYLVDMEGQPAHVWSVSGITVQSYCQLLPNGNLMVPTHDRSDVAQGNVGLFELDPQSHIVWSYRCRVDHDFQIRDNGNLLIHQITENMWPPLGPELKRQPYMIEITRQKDLVWQWRGEEHLEDLRANLSPEAWDHVMERATGRFAFDWAHNNTLQLIGPNATYEKEKAAGGRIRFKPGNIIFSYRSCDVIGVIEYETGKIVWAWGPGVLDGQHKPHMLANGNLLIFDNGTLRGYSRVIELNPLTHQIEWEFDGKPDHAFFSPYISSAQRLPNGNTLICDGAHARLFEVTPDKEVVWDFVNPYHNPYASRAIYRCLRYSPEYVQPLLAGQ